VRRSVLGSLLGIGFLTVSLAYAQPTVQITQPRQYEVFTRGATVMARAKLGTSSGMQRVEFLVDGKSIGDATWIPWERPWDTTSYAATSHAIQARLYTGGQAYVSETVYVFLLDPAAATSQDKPGRLAYQAEFRPGRPVVAVMNLDGTEFATVPSRGDETGRSPSWSPDGVLLAFTRTVAGKQKYFTVPVDVHNAAMGPPLQITFGPSDDSGLTWSRDGKRIAYLAEQDGTHSIAVGPIGGDMRVLVTTAVGDSSPTSLGWGPEDKSISYSMDRSIWLLDPVTGDHRLLIAKADMPVWSHNGRYLALFTGKDPRTLTIYDSWTAAMATVQPFVDHPRSIAWSPDDKRLLFVAPHVGKQSGRLWLVNIDGTGLRSLSVRGAPLSDVSWGLTPPLKIQLPAAEPAGDQIGKDGASGSEQAPSDGAK